MESQSLLFCTLLVILDASGPVFWVGFFVCVAITCWILGIKIKHWKSLYDLLEKNHCGEKSTYGKKICISVVSHIFFMLYLYFLNQIAVFKKTISFGKYFQMSKKQCSLFSYPSCIFAVLSYKEINPALRHLTKTLGVLFSLALVITICQTLFCMALLIPLFDPS